MENILFVNACVREDSRTLILARELLHRCPGKVDTVVLDTENIPPMNGRVLAEREAHIREGVTDVPMFRYAKQFAAADTIIVAAPCWDLAFPALLKIYLEAVTVLGITFRYTPEGRPASLCRAKRLFYVTTVGGPLSRDLGFEYIRFLAQNFYGISDIRRFGAEGLDLNGADVPAILQRAVQTIRTAEL